STGESLTNKAPEATPPPAENIAAQKREEVVFETPLYIATFWNVGGVLKSFRLKGYSDGEGQPVQLINQQAGEKVGWPLTLVTGDKAIDDQLRDAPFAVHRDPTGLVLEYASNGLYARKAIGFDSNTYEFSLETRLTKDGKAIPYAVTWQGNFGDQSIPEDATKKHGVY